MMPPFCTPSADGVVIVALCPLCFCGCGLSLSLGDDFTYGGSACYHVVRQAGDFLSCSMAKNALSLAAT